MNNTSSRRLEEFDSVTSTPVNLRNLIVYYDLHYSIHVENNDVPIKKFSHLTREKTFFNILLKILMFLHI